jgi:mannan endo-1,4-beta-mannosidase
MGPVEPSRRAVVSTGLVAAALGALPGFGSASKGPPSIRIADDAPGRPISRLIYGSNEIGAMDRGPPSATFDRIAQVTARRLGGNLMTSYNWVNNAANAGKDFENANGAFLLEALRLPKTEWTRPAAVIEAMHAASLELGALSLVTLPLAGFVAADLNGPVAPGETAPSARFVPVRWASDARARDPIDPRVADMPQLLSRLIERYGGAGEAAGIHAFALDNEPGLWVENHPRICPVKTTIRSFIARSIAAARVIKSIDPAAKIFGPASWGATGMVNFQNAPDWSDYRRFGSFLAAYLDAFREASERDGRRLLDVLDVHWYATSRRGELYRTGNPDLAEVLLDAPRSLDEPGFREDSWVSRALGGDGDGVTLPILPSLERLAARWFPGTALAITEFNYGGAGQLASGLALADVLGRFGAAGVYFASHWGSLKGWLGEAYRLYREPDATGGAFGDLSLNAKIGGDAAISAHAARGVSGLQLVVINKGTQAAAVDVVFATGQTPRLAAALGFDAAHPTTLALPEEAKPVDGALRLELPPRAARRYAFV